MDERVRAHAHVCGSVCVCVGASALHRSCPGRPLRSERRLLQTQRPAAAPVNVGSLGDQRSRHVRVPEHSGTMERREPAVEMRSRTHRSASRRRV